MNRDFKGVWISKDIWLNPDLDITEKALFAEIDSLDTENGCTASNKYFTEFFRISESTVTRAISHLKELGLIESSFDGKIRTLRVVKLTRQSSQIDEHINTVNSDISNTQLNIIQDNTNITNKEDTYKIKGQKFVDDFNSICKSLPKCTRLTVKRSKGISNILKKYSYDDILTVFEKLEESDFCTNRGGKGWRADIDFILREDKFVSVLEGKYDNQGRRCNVETISQGNKKHLSAEEREAIIKNGKKF
jgi:DNA-binding MarR family transcriptional regulator